MDIQRKSSKNFSVVLVNPPSFRRAEYHDTPMYPNISIAYIAAAIKKAGFNKCVNIDAKLERLSVRETIEKILRNNPDIVGLTALTNDIEQLRIVAEGLKEYKPDIVIVAGGVHVSALPKQSLEQIQAIDFILINEAELTFPRLLNALSGQNEPISKIPNLYYRINDRIVINEKAEWIENLDELPLPAWDMFPPAKHYPVITARGCPFGCRFCNPMGKIVRERSVEKVLQEVEQVVQKYKPEFIWFYDETFGLNKKRVATLLKGFIEMNLGEKTKWFASTRINTTTMEFMTDMYRAGCRKIGFGIEAGSERILNEKKVDIQKAKRLVRHGRDLGMTVFTYFILGHPDETLNEMLKTVKLAAQINSTYPVFGIMVPYPGTEIYDLAKKQQAGYKLIAKSWNDYNKHIGSALEFTKVGNGKVEFLRLFGYIYFFVRNLRFIDFFVFCREYFSTALGVLKNLYKRV